MDAEDRLHANGYRVTPQRHLVLEAVRAVPHATPELIYQHVRERSPGMTASTVYRALEVLEEVGLVTHAHIDTGPPRYHAAENAPHLHFRCLKCGDVQSLPVTSAAGFSAEVFEALKFRVDMTHAGIHGICHECEEDS